jgi:signal transduction histidine kinase
MKKLTEGRKMFLSVMAIFVIYATIFILFQDFDKTHFEPFEETSGWHMLLFSIVVMAVLAFLLHRYSRRMDERISREQADKENQMRRELTQNIAHELKTPVASIKGYAETILEHPEISTETRHQFVERTLSQATRLTSLLEDISTLNRMDYADSMIAFEPVDVAPIVADVVKETAHALESKKMTMCNNLPQETIVQGNPSLIYSIFRNLVDNAINYAGEGTTITIDAREEKKEWAFMLADNGVGIREEHLTRIFERFYRVDKGRSRALGGTGLGLAIVKNAVVLHGGNIKAQNAEGGGLRFDFTLKK